MELTMTAAAITRTADTASIPAVTARPAGNEVILESGASRWQAGVPHMANQAVEAPSPTAYLLGALASYAVTFIRDTLAPELHIDVWDVRATARCEAGATAPLQQLVLEVDVYSPYNRAVVQRLLDAWREQWPAHLAFVDPASVRVECRVTSQ
jgi:hypothetical protein